MLKGIPSVISPDLLKVLCEMGHGDRICFSDSNFPAETIGKNSKVLRFDSIKMPELLDAVLQLMPLDTYTDSPVELMQVMPGDPVKTPIWDEYKKVVSKYDSRGADAFCEVERFEFYERAKECYAVVATGETAVYANIILQKGVISE